MEDRIRETSAAILALKDSILTLQERLHSGAMAAAVPNPPTLPSKVKLPVKRRTLQGHSAKVTSLYWARNCVDLATTCQEGRLVLWNSLLGSPLIQLQLRSSWYALHTMQVHSFL